MSSETVLANSQRTVPWLTVMTQLAREDPLTATLQMLLKPESADDAASNRLNGIAEKRLPAFHTGVW